MNGIEDRLARWLEALERRHLAELTLPEVRRGLQALSSIYVERREKLPSGAVFDGAGKRAAFALFYGPLHFLVVREIVRALAVAAVLGRSVSRIVDLGCGTGAAGAAWVLELGGGPVLEAVDHHPWAVAETAWTLRALGVRGRSRRAGLETVRLGGSGEAILAAFTVNELPQPVRRLVLERLLDAVARGAVVLVVEPISRRTAPWWASWTRAFRAAGGRGDDWRFSADLPPLLQRLDRAAHLDHSSLTARTLIAGPCVTSITFPPRDERQLE